MKLALHDWDTRADVAVEYPDEIVQPFVQYMLRAKRWEWDNEVVITKLAKMKKLMFEHRNKLANDARDRAQFESDLAEYIDQEIPGVLGTLVAQETNE